MRKWISRFAPSTTGEAHPGTLLAALLCWLDARQRGATIILRLEDLDVARCRPEWRQQMPAALEWLGLDWDKITSQSVDSKDAVEAALDQLTQRGVVYRCLCSRSEIRQKSQKAPDGSWRYPNTCRERLLEGDWRDTTENLRVRLPPGEIVVNDQSGATLIQDPSVDMGDPVVRRRDGVMTYHLGVVVDDGRSAVNHIVRGMDLFVSTPTQIALQRLLGAMTPSYHHHLLLLENQEQKLAKFHGSVGFTTLSRFYRPDELCGFLAWCAGLMPAPTPCRPNDLLPDFDWRRVRKANRIIRWDGTQLTGVDTHAV